MDKISIIVPCYNEEKALPFFYDEIYELMREMDYVDFEVLFIDDGSKDNTLVEIKKITKVDERIHYISFSRNFGKEAAMYAGFEHCHGDYVVVMDADLQDPPDLLKEMYQAVTIEGYDSAATRRVTRKGEPKIRSFFARVFYKIMKHISDADIVDGARDYRLMRRSMVEAIVSMGEYNRFSKGIFGWIGFRTKWIEFENVERIAGETKWSFWQLFKYSLDGITAFSVDPLQIASIFGTFFSLIAFIMILVIIVKTLVFGDPTSGWPSMACIVMLIGGIQLLCIGILGQYLSKTYLETKKRPIYIERESDIDQSM